MKTIISKLEKIKADADAGNMDPLKAFCMFKNIMKVADNAAKELQEQATKEAIKYGKGQREAFGFKFQVKTVGARWDFKNVEAVQDKQKELKKLQESLKSMAQARMNNTDLTAVDESTGEVQQLPVYRAGTETVTIL